MKRFNKMHQRGFTLVEILVVLAIITLLVLLMANAFDGSRSKAQVMLGMGKQVADANINLKTDTGCYVNSPRALFDSAFAALPANNYCSRTFGANWARPYLANYSVDASNNLRADKIAAEATVGFNREAVGNGWRYFVRFNNIPMDVVHQALVECNNDDSVVGSFPTNRCRAGAVTGSTPTTFDIVFDTVR